MKRSKYLLMWIALLMLAGMACNLSLNLPGGSEQPDVEVTGEDVIAAATNIPTVVAEGAGALATVEALATRPVAVLDEFLGAVIQPDENGDFTLEVTQPAFNEYLATQEAEALAAGRTWPLQNAQVVFADGVVTLTGDVTDPIATTLSADLLVGVENGRLQFDVQSATAGGFPIPTAARDTVASGVNSAIGVALQQLPADIVLEQATVGDGIIVIEGRQN